MSVVRFIAIAVFVISCCSASSGYAKSKSDELAAVKNKLSEETAQKKALEQKIDTINNEVSDIKKQLVEAATSVRKNEDGLKYIEQRVDILHKKKQAIETTLKDERVSIVKLILILERIRKTPPQALLAQPDSPYKIAQSALLMENIIPSVKRHAETLKNNLETLQRVTNELEIERVALESETNLLKKKNANLQTLVNKKEQVYSKINRDLKARELTIQNISLKADNLEELVKNIKQEEQKEITRQKQANIFRKKPDIPLNDTGQAQLPISGIIRTGYNGKDDLGAQSKGITIEGRSGGLVIAPMGGKIQFAGTFKRYGNIVIIEHAEGFHSLIAGLDKINGTIGDHVKSGEPIGLLPDSSLIPRPKLYYELRQNGTPVNPAVKFSDLG